MKRLYIVLFLSLISLIPIYAQTSIPKAQSLFVYNFTRLIEWPSAYKSGDFVVGVIGSGSLSNELGTTLQGKRVSQQVIRFENYKDASEITNCHILVVPFGKSNELENIITKIGNQGTLIITEKNGMLDKGAVINFVIDGNSLKFELNKDAATKRGLTVSSTLEKMAVQ